MATLDIQLVNGHAIKLENVRRWKILPEFHVLWVVMDDMTHNRHTHTFNLDSLLCWEWEDLSYMPAQTIEE